MPARSALSGAAFQASPAGLLRARRSGRVFRCALGRGGVVAAADKREGDGATPAGVWALGPVYWRADRLGRPPTALPVIATRPEMGWCDDPADPAYNRPVELPYPASHERLWREDGIYDLVAVLAYNSDPVIPGAGSAIFLHIARPDFRPTEGCVACAREDLLEILAESQPGDALAIAL